MVRTFIRRKGEEHSEEVDLNKYVGVVTAEMVRGFIRVKHQEFVRKEDV